MKFKTSFGIKVSRRKKMKLYFTLQFRLKLSPRKKNNKTEQIQDASTFVL